MWLHIRFGSPLSPEKSRRRRRTRLGMRRPCGHQGETRLYRGREYKSRSYLCADCPTKAMCTQNAKCEKTVTRHIWQRFVDMAEDVRHTPLYRDIYKLRQQKIERVFAMQKKSTVCAIRSTEAWLRLPTGWSLNLLTWIWKKLATWKWKRKNPSPGKRRRRIFPADYFSWLLFFPFQTKKPALAWLLRQTFSTGGGGTQLGAACFCTSKGRKSPIFVSVKQGQWKRWNSYRFCAVPLWNSELLRGEHHSLGRVYICGRAKYPTKPQSR